MHQLLAVFMALPNACLLAWGWRRCGLALGAGGISSFALPPYGLWPLLAGTIPVLVWLLDGAVEHGSGRNKQRLLAGFSIGWWFGFGFFLAGFWWIGSAFLVDGDRFAWMMPFAVVAMPTGLALFPAIAMSVVARFWSEGSWRLLLLALALSTSDYIRGHILTGFPWNTFGYVFADTIVLAQTASLIGVYGLGLLALLVFSTPAVLADSIARGKKIVIMGAGALCLLGMGIFGAVRLFLVADPDVSAVDLRIVQPAVAQNEKWLPENRERIFQSYLDLSSQSWANNARSGVERLLIWPESAVPFLLTDSPDALVRIAGVLDGDMSFVTGAVRAEPSADGAVYFNSVYLFDPDGTVQDAYDKVHLVPFGEYLPLEDLLETLGLKALVNAPGTFQPGFRNRVLSLQSGTSFQPLICYEAIFPEIAGSTDTRADFLLNVTNDAWFGDSPGPYQHLAQAKMRSIEQGLPLVRAANTGVSAVFDAKGRKVAFLSIGERGALDVALPGKMLSTGFSKYGDFFFFAMTFLLLGLILAQRHNRHSRKN
ncbi:apolipoprotein N-acyltransferase [Roseibium algae]|uniref:Apolipoprotein N-acyltransferase n=1 Tax=Roseibium algae TaxID=3123038 RepID=A0ABU8TLS8_9HYPH